MPSKIRWYGEPSEDQPDAGDVLAYVVEGKPDWWHLVHYARPVRGGSPEDLWLMVERLDLIDCPPYGRCGIPDAVVEAFSGGHWFSAERRKRRRT